MTGLGIGLMLRRSAKALSGLAGWLLERPMRLVVALLAFALAWHFVFLDPRLRHDRDVARGAVQILAQRAVGEKRAHQQTKAVYRAAQLEAARLERARLERVRAQQQEITDEVATDYRRRLADARSRAEQLRGELARAGEHPASTGGAVGLPAAGDAAGRIDEAAGYPRLPAEQLERDLIATEQAHQLDALIRWVEAQSKVDLSR